MKACVRIHSTRKKTHIACTHASCFCHCYHRTHAHIQYDNTNSGMPPSRDMIRIACVYVLTYMHIYAHNNSGMPPSRDMIRIACIYVLTYIHTYAHNNSGMPSARDMIHFACVYVLTYIHTYAHNNSGMPSARDMIHIACIIASNVCSAYAKYEVANKISERMFEFDGPRYVVCVQVCVSV